MIELCTAEIGGLYPDSTCRCGKREGHKGDHECVVEGCKHHWSQQDQAEYDAAEVEHEMAR